MNYLKKIKNGDLKLNYFKFSEIPTLGNFTRCKSFIINDYCEVSSNLWYDLYIKVVNALQKIRPINEGDLLLKEAAVSRGRMYLQEYKYSYVSTDFGLYVKGFSGSNMIVSAISRLLSIYDFDKSECYLVVESTPDGEVEKDEVIAQEKMKFCQYMKDVYVEGEYYYQIAVEVIDELNQSLKYYSNTFYNNLYLLNSLSDYVKYSTLAIKTQNDRPNNKYTLREMELSVEWLKRARYYGNDLFSTSLNTDKGFFIEEEDKTIYVTFQAHFYK